ncbi:hypothetical protein EV644_109138 [Kribbella orskensis]|uniref:Uncharacterized protein n=1 Tax=Kribbella orskensis TaxID=2512216 RepID=A0ABY2BHC1_9ACTN|nr:hypothetical protein EV642_109138 [Kribbella sp. VKM Ac-2500]TCO20117.1 hypothetical protein EV644_109138 [Kribbella orskensis]
MCAGERFRWQVVRRLAAYKAPAGERPVSGRPKAHLVHRVSARGAGVCFALGPISRPARVDPTEPTCANPGPAVQEPDCGVGGWCAPSRTPAGGGSQIRRPVVKRGRPDRSCWSRISVKRVVEVKTAGADSPWTSACSQPNQPPGFSKRPAVAATTLISSKPSSPDHKANAGSWSRTSAVTDSQAVKGMYGGFEITASTFPFNSGRHPSISPSCKVAPVPAKFRRAQTQASGDNSTACTVLSGRSVATAPAIAPEPLQRSTTSGASTPTSRSRIHPTSTSVSGRGTNTPGPTASSRYRNAAVPVRCCSGSR